MQKTSELWKSMVGKRGTRTEYKWLIAGTEYTEDDEDSHRITPSLFSSFGFGNATICKLELNIYADTIPSGAKIERFCRLVNDDAGEVSEWIPKGIFWAKSRYLNDDLWELEAYDAMRKADTEWTPDQALEFPMTMPDAVAVFCELMGVELDERTELNPTYTIDYPANGYTIRNELAYIAAAHGGNWIITFDGKLYLVPLKQNASAAVQHAVGNDLVEMKDAGQFAAVSKVVLMLDSTNCYEAGDDTGTELVADCPFATEAMAVAVLKVVQGYVYQAYEAEEANIDPAYELGDVIEVDGVTSIIVSVDDDGLGFPNLTAPGRDEQQDDYPSGDGPKTQEFNRKIAETQATITKTAEEIKLQVDAVDGRCTTIQQTVDGITLEVVEQAGADGQVYAQISLGIGPNKYSGYIKMTGNLDVSGQLSADALYAKQGDIASLTVDRLSTSRRVALYLAKDMSDDNYIRIHDEQIEFVTGTTDGSREQATTPEGLKIYWEADIEDAEIGADGYPYIDGQRIFTTTAETDWPVYVYSYAELVKASMHFEMVGEYYLPIMTFGAGDDSGWNKAWIVKEAEAVKFLYRTTSGTDLGMVMYNTGYTDVYGLRHTTFMDFSEWSFGKFYEMLDGIEKEIEYGVEFDDLGRPVKITEGEHVCDIRWGDNM